jgi:hypothetical protein
VRTTECFSIFLSLWIFLLRLIASMYDNSQNHCHPFSSPYLIHSHLTEQCFFLFHHPAMSNFPMLRSILLAPIAHLFYSNQNHSHTNYESWNFLLWNLIKLLGRTFSSLYFHTPTAHSPIWCLFLVVLPLFAFELRGPSIDFTQNDELFLFYAFLVRIFSLGSALGHWVGRG